MHILHEPLCADISDLFIPSWSEGSGIRFKTNTISAGSTRLSSSPCSTIFDTSSLQAQNKPKDTENGQLEPRICKNNKQDFQNKFQKYGFHVFNPSMSSCLSLGPSTGFTPLPGYLCLQPCAILSSESLSFTISSSNPNIVHLYS